MDALERGHENICSFLQSQIFKENQALFFHILMQDDTSFRLPLLFLHNNDRRIPNPTSITARSIHNFHQLFYDTNYWRLIEFSP